MSYSQHGADKKVEYVVVWSECIVTRTGVDDPYLFQDTRYCVNEPDQIGQSIQRSKEEMVRSMLKQDLLFGSMIGSFQSRVGPDVVGPDVGLACMTNLKP